ncbi:hypothetical protein ACFYV7_36135 [Nocardia suismassiliense]|uniref:Uncharacterized protein n=1 Tax=Nocardia suismassiliense TaxID=2077092 RepID=A0ABW6R430_9NOCA
MSLAQPPATALRGATLFAVPDADFACPDSRRARTQDTARHEAPGT